MASIKSIRSSDGTGVATVPKVTTPRDPNATTLVVDSVDNLPETFYGSMGTPHTFVDPVTSEIITIISEATAVDFEGRVDGENIEIVAIGDGFTDLGSQVDDIIIIKPTTDWANNVADVLDVSHEDDGTLKRAAIDTASQATVGLLGNVRVYELSGSPHTWTKPANLKFIEVEAVGGGGAGGGRMSTNAGQLSAGGGGGGGGYCYKKINAASLSSTETVTIGAHGTGSNGASGSAGGDTTFGVHFSAGGGGGGTSGREATAHQGSMGDGGSGGVATGGDLNINGQPGGSGSSFAGIPFRGNGGGSMFGNPTTFYGATGNTTSGSGIGAGGSGTNGGAAVSAASGAAGAAGIVIVREYY